MKILKLLLVAMVMTITGAVSANPNSPSIDRKKSVSYEIQKMLHQSNLIIEDEIKIRVFFSISVCKKIQIRSINSNNKEVCDFLRNRLQDRQVYGDQWEEGKLYVLPVLVEPGK